MDNPYILNNIFSFYNPYKNMYNMIMYQLKYKNIYNATLRQLQRYNVYNIDGEILYFAKNAILSFE